MLLSVFITSNTIDAVSGFHNVRTVSPLIILDRNPRISTRLYHSVFGSTRAFRKNHSVCLASRGIPDAVSQAEVEYEDVTRPSHADVQSVWPVCQCGTSGSDGSSESQYDISMPNGGRTRSPDASRRQDPKVDATPTSAQPTIRPVLDDRTVDKDKPPKHLAIEQSIARCEEKACQIGVEKAIKRPDYSRQRSGDRQSRDEHSRARFHQERLAEKV